MASKSCDQYFLPFTLVYYVIHSPIITTQDKNRREEEERKFPFGKRWALGGKLSPWPRDYYYVDPVKKSDGPMKDRDELLQEIYKGNFVVLHGPRLSGKSTRISRIMQILQGDNISSI